MPMKETDMLNAWLWKNHRTSTQWRRVRLGVLPTKEMARMYAVLLRWADAIVLEKGQVKIIEAKLRPDPGAVGQLELYKQLFPHTPEFSEFKNWPLVLVLLTATLDLNMVEMCSKKGIQYEVFSQDDVNKVRAQLLQPILL